MTINPNILASDHAALVGVIDPDVTVASTVQTGWVNMANFERLMAVIFAGTLGASATVDAKLEQAQDGSGTGAKDVTGKAITQLTQAGGDSDKQSIINLSADELDVNNSFTHARLTVTIGAATSDACGALFGLVPRYGPASDNDAASVAEIIA